MNAKVDSLALAAFEAYSRNSGNPPECHRDLDAAIEWMAQALIEVGVAELIEAATEMYELADTPSAGKFDTAPAAFLKADARCRAALARIGADA